jgi:hypothetical protein
MRCAAGSSRSCAYADLGQFSQGDIGVQVGGGLARRAERE